MSAETYRKSALARIDARVPVELKDRITTAATLEGRTVTDFLISAAAQHASDVIEQHQRITLSKKESMVFAKALLSPPKPSKASITAARRYLKSKV